MLKIKSLFLFFDFKDAVLYLVFYIINRQSTRFKELDKSFHQFINSPFKASGELNSIFNKKYYLLLENQTSSFRFEVRKKSSDFKVIQQIFEEFEYLDPLKKIRALIELSAHPIIIDAGANIGASALYFQSEFPKAKIVCLEPFPATRTQLINNFLLNQLKSQIFPFALWSSNTTLDFDRSIRDISDWSVRTFAKKNGKTNGITISSFLDKVNTETVDIFKIDIEGSEFELFLTESASLQPLDRIKSMILEIHDDAGDRQELIESICLRGFEHFEFRELTLFLNSKFMK